MACSPRTPPRPARSHPTWRSPGAAFAALTLAACTAASPSQGAGAAPGARCAPPSGPVRSGQGASGPAVAMRVDQIGYPTAAPKVAEIMSASRRGPLRWVLVDRRGCTVAARGVATAGAGRWSSRYPQVARVSFSSVRAAGTYRLALASGQAASPWFRIAPASRLYASALANALSFYQNERDGAGFIASRLRSGPGHLNDSRAMTYRTPAMNGNGEFRGSLARYATGRVINASGGWFDAGDYLKFAETTSYTVAMMLQGVVSFPRQLGAGAAADFTGEAKFGLDFLRRLWDQRTRTLYYQVGIGEANSRYAGDHDLWRLPQADDTFGGSDPRYRYIRHRPVFRAGPPGALVSPNLAGRLAASFALCYRVFRVTDPGYADGCLRSAETVYRLAGTAWRGRLLTVAPYSFYPETTWRDDMMLGATELSLALAAAGSPTRLPSGLPVRSAAAYLRQAAAWARSWIRSGQATSDTLNLYDVSGLAYYELSRAIGQQHLGGLAVSRAQLAGALGAQLRRAQAVAARDPFRFGFAWAQEDTAAHGAGLSVLAHEYGALTGRRVMAGPAQGWLDAIVGANAWGVSFIVGDGTFYPHCLSHQVANLAGSRNGRPPALAGATVEGPDSFAATGQVDGMRACDASAPGGTPYRAFGGHGAVFADNVQSYSTTEPAIDLTALTPMAFAWQEAASGVLPPP